MRKRCVIRLLYTFSNIRRSSMKTSCFKDVVQTLVPIWIKLLRTVRGLKSRWELRAVAQRIEREIHILHANGHTTILTPQEIAHSNSESIAINVGQIGEVHYVSLQSITNFDDNYVSAQPQNEETQSDRRGWYLRQPTEPAFASWKMRQYRVKADG